VGARIGYYDSKLVGAFRFTKDGRRIWAKRYLVSDADLDRVQARIRAQGMFAIPLIVSAVEAARHIWGEHRWWVGLIPILPLEFLCRRWIASGLSIVAVPKSELEPINRRALDLIRARTMGRPVSWTFLVLSLAMTAFAVVDVFGIGGGDWAGWFLLVAFPACAFIMGRQLWQLRNDPS
jgi:hypothetical protein